MCAKNNIHVRKENKTTQQIVYEQKGGRDNKSGWSAVWWGALGEGAQPARQTQYRGGGLLQFSDTFLFKNHRKTFLI